MLYKDFDRADHLGWTALFKDEKSRPLYRKSCILDLQGVRYLAF